MPTITGIALAHLAQAVRRLGARTDEIFGDLSIDLAFEDRVPIARVIEVWERAVEVTKRRDLPAIVVSYALQDERSLIGFVVANQPRFSDGIDRFHRFAPTLSDAYCWQIVDEAGETRAVLSPAGPIQHAGWQYYVEHETLDIARVAARLTNDRARPLAVRFLHAAPSPDVTAAYAAAGGVTPEFGCDRCEVVFPASIRTLSVPNARPALAAVVEAKLEHQLAAIQRGAPITARARNAIATLLERRTLGVDELAKELHMSRRSLERALELEGSSASELIEEERKQRALAWLPALTVEDVAARLGYSDARAFARAFKRWTGTTPSARRRQR